MKLIFVVQVVPAVIAGCFTALLTTGVNFFLFVLSYLANFGLNKNNDDDHGTKRKTLTTLKRVDDTATATNAINANIVAANTVLTDDWHDPEMTANATSRSGVTNVNVDHNVATTNTYANHNAANNKEEPEEHNDVETEPFDNNDDSIAATATTVEGYKKSVLCDIADGGIVCKIGTTGNTDGFNNRADRSSRATNENERVDEYRKNVSPAPATGYTQGGE